MWKLIPLLIIFSAPSARADLTHSLSSSISLDVHGAATVSERVGSSYSVSGNNINLTATADVNIPSGVEDGTRIRLSGEGEAGLNGSPPGDLYIFITISPHYIFQRRN